MEGVTKTCANCKREIPSVNFTIHSVHCVRNIRVCPVCKEPVPAADLITHHNQLHKLVPCKQCGEDVCGSDLEDHLRDSCALTPAACRHCELELPRRELPAHEAYCGSRTQRCSCGELVMIKYQQLHEQSNHGFIKLEDEPGPEPSWAKYERTQSGRPQTDSTSGIPLSTNQHASTSDFTRTNRTANGTNIQPTTAKPSGSDFRTPENSNRPIVENNSNLRKVPVKRTNDKPQINTTVPETSKVNKDLPTSPPRGGVKKRPAPPPPRVPPAAGAPPARDAAYWSALTRQQREERERQQQTAYNLSVGLPPVLSPAEKLEKLRKMDALAQREFADPNEYAVRLRAWEPPPPPVAGEVVGRGAAGAGDEASGAGSSLQPMSAAEFGSRFARLQLGAAAEVEAEGGARGTDDRFGDIKRELGKLRRGLNEVTAPYNSASFASPANAVRAQPVLAPPPRAPTPPPPYEYLQEYHGIARDADGNEVALPCEFCGQLVSPDLLVLHETGCRPDLAQYNVQPANPDLLRGNANIVRDNINIARDNVNLNRGDFNNARANANDRDDDMGEPVIPCEFCMHPYPMHQLMDHQEGCLGPHQYQPAGAV